MAKEKSLEELQVEHSELCARAADAGVQVPEDLTVDFDDVEAGAAICAALHVLLGDKTIAEGAEVEHSASSDAPSAPTKKKRAARKATSTKQAVAPAAAQPTERQVAKTAKKAKAKKSKAPAKRAKGKTTAKKAAATNGTGKKRAPKGSGPVATVIGMLKKGTTRAAVLEATGWKAVSMQQLAKGAGVKLKVDESERPFKYRVA